MCNNSSSVKIVLLFLFYLFNSAEEYIDADRVQGRGEVWRNWIRLSQRRATVWQEEGGGCGGAPVKPGSITYCDVREAWRGNMLWAMCVCGCAIVAGQWRPSGRVGLASSFFVSRLVGTTCAPGTTWRKICYNIFFLSTTIFYFLRQIFRTIENFLQATLSISTKLIKITYEEVCT